MRNALVKMAFAILKRHNATMWWNTADVPGLFDPALNGKVVFRFAEMRFFPPTAKLRTTAAEVNGFNFVHTCPPDCPE